ncbi:hypothetical protein NXW09_28315 [Bacteroides ovatus]|nr:hypothetical protein [Bacteroides ovatus]
MKLLYSLAENGQGVMTLPATFPSERLQKVDRRNGDMAGYWTGTPQMTVMRL